MIDERAVINAERSVATRKAVLASQWLSLRTRLRDSVTQPTTLGAVALVGGIMGWRSAAPQKSIEVKCTCAGKPRPSLVSGGLRALAMATLQAAASIASEELIRGTIERAPRDGRSNDGRFEP